MAEKIRYCRFCGDEVPRIVPFDFHMVCLALHNAMEKIELDTKDIHFFNPTNTK